MPREIYITSEQVEELGLAMEMTKEAEESEREEACNETYMVESGRRFRAYMMEIAGGIADVGLVETQFAKMLKVYKEQILGNWHVRTALTTVIAQFENDELFPIEAPDIRNLFSLYFKSIGFRTEIWLDGHHISWSNIKL